MFTPIAFDFEELYSVFVSSIVGVHITLSCNVQRMFQLSINTFVCISSELRNDSRYILEGVVEFKIYLNYRL